LKQFAEGYTAPGEKLGTAATFGTVNRVAELAACLAVVGTKPWKKPLTPLSWKMILLPCKYTTLKQFAEGYTAPGEKLGTAATFGIGGLAGLITV
jgi:hypothetical protein